MKIALSLTLGLIVGCISTILVGRQFIKEIDNKEVIRWQLAELMKGNLVAKGEQQQVVLLIRNYIEDGICKDYEMQSLYKSARNRKLVAQEIEQFYFSLREEPPLHVRSWLENKKIVFNSVKDSFTQGRFKISKKNSDNFITVESEFKNISDLIWKDLAVSASLRDNEGNEISSVRKVSKKSVKPGGIFAISFQLDYGSLEWPAEVSSPQVRIYGGEKVAK